MGRLGSLGRTGIPVEAAKDSLRLPELLRPERGRGRSHAGVSLYCPQIQSAFSAIPSCTEARNSRVPNLKKEVEIFPWRLVSNSVLPI
jgi:hypothetical protein